MTKKYGQEVAQACAKKTNVRGRYKKPSHAQKQMLLKLLRCNLSGRKAAKLSGIKYTTARDILRREMKEKGLDSYQELLFPSNEANA